MADWPAETYNEVLGQELAQRVLASADALQEEEARAAAVLDSNPTTTGTGSHDTTALGTITQSQETCQQPIQKQHVATAPTAITGAVPPAGPTALTTAVATANAAIPTQLATQDDNSTEYDEYMQLQENGHQQNEAAPTKGQALLAALHDAHAHGVNLDGILADFVTETSTYTPQPAGATAPMQQDPSRATAPMQQDPMEVPIPKRPRQEAVRQETVPIWDVRRSYQPEASAIPDGGAFFNKLFPSKSRARSVPLPSRQFAPSYSPPCDIFTASDNAQAMGFYSQGKLFSVIWNLLRNLSCHFKISHY